MNYISLRFQKITLLLVFCQVLLTSCSEQEEYEIEIPVSAVPDKILSEVNKELPGIEIIEAEIESNAKLHYELEGTLDGKEFEIEIYPDGSIIEIELEQEKEDSV
jgi:peptidase YpeB-like protein